MAVPKPHDRSWLIAAADELRLGDRETLDILQESYRHVNQILKGLPDTPDAAFGNLIYRAQLERTRRKLLEEQTRLFEKLGDKVSARRLRAATRAAKLSAASDAALLSLVGEGENGQRLYDGAEVTAQRTVETLLARMGLSKVPLAERIYKTSVWMNNRLDRLITRTMAAGLNARRFAREARDWFSPSVPGGTRYAAYRLARTEINNAFHATSVAYAQDKPWVSKMEWNLSKSHPEPDKCDEYAARSPWPVTEVPRKPHPQCMCYVTEAEVDEDDWIDRFADGEFDQYLDGELAKADQRLSINRTQRNKEPVKAPVAVAVKPDPEATAVRTEPLTGKAALESVPKGLFKRGSMTPDQRKALQTYESGWFSVINDFLRRGLWGDPDYAKEERDVNRINSAMADSSLPNDVQVWRGMFNSSALFGDRLGNDLTGFSWEEKAFSSTTADESVVQKFNTPDALDENIKMKVLVPAGVKALATSTFEKGSPANGPQAELTLQPGLKWTVVKDNGIDESGVRQLEVRADPISESADTATADAGATGRELSGSSAERTEEPARTDPAVYDERLSKAATRLRALQAAQFGLDRKLGSKNYNRMEPDMRRGINQYTGSWYRQINRFLRTGDIQFADEEAEVRTYIAGIDAAMAGSVMAEDAVTYRGMHSARAIFGDRIDNDLTDFAWREDAFVSTTASDKRTRLFLAGPDAADRVLLRILVPKGASAVEASGLNAEAELLINRGYEFRVVRDNGISADGVRHLDIELLPSRYPEATAVRSPGAP